MDPQFLIWLVASLLGLGILVYFVTLALAFIFNVKRLSKFKQMIESNMAFNVGIPASGIGAFGIVALFWSAFPQLGPSEEPLSLQFLDLEFTGPSGPITLWMACFLSLVFAMYLLRKN